MKCGREAVGDDVLKRSECLEETAFFELRRKALLIFERADEAVRCAIDEAFGAKFKDGRVGAGRARAGSGAGALVGSGRRGTRSGPRAVVARGVVRPSAARRRRGGEDRVGRLSGGGAFGAREASVLGRIVAKCDV